MPKARLALRIAVVGTILVSMPQRARSTEALDTLRTEHATYTISETETSNQCLYKNGDLLLCGADFNLYFDEIIKTKNYVLIPLHSQCGGNGCPFQDVWLVIENGSRTFVKHVADECYGCKLKSLHVNIVANAATFKIGNRRGYKLSASFQNGTFLVHRSKIGTTIDAETCRELHEAIKSCAATKTERCISPYHLSASGNRQMRAIENNYPFFSEDAFDKACESTCSSGKEITYQEFSQKTCHREF